MSAAFVRPFLWMTLLMFVTISIGDVWRSLRKQPPPRPRPEWSKRISQPVASAILCVFIALLFYCAWPSPELLGLFVGAFLTLPVKGLIRRIQKRTGAATEL